MSAVWLSLEVTVNVYVFCFVFPFSTSEYSLTFPSPGDSLTFSPPGGGTFLSLFMCISYCGARLLRYVVLCLLLPSPLSSVLLATSCSNSVIFLLLLSVFSRRFTNSFLKNYSLQFFLFIPTASCGSHYHV